jgi:hypothetical protein
MQPMMKAPKYVGSVLRDDVTLVSDPAPSLLSYRMQRLWLTPLFRALVRVGLPTFSIVGLGWAGMGRDLMTLPPEYRIESGWAGMGWGGVWCGGTTGRPRPTDRPTE